MSYRPERSEAYAPLYAPPPGPVMQPNYGDGKGEYVRFQAKKKVNDPIFLVLFILQFIGFAAVSGFALFEWVKQGGLKEGQVGAEVTLNWHTIYLLLIIAGVALILATIYLFLVREFTSIIMHITLILSVALNIAICVYYWITKLYGPAIVFTVIAIISLLSYFGFRSRIPFSALLLKVVVDVSKHHRSVYVVAFSTLILQTLFNIWFAFTLIATYAKWTPGGQSCNTGTSCSKGVVLGLVIFEVFSFLWTTQVIGNVALATLAGGPYGTWYYQGPRPSGQTWSAFGRASTLSLGSIAFGSLIVTVLELIRLVLQAVRQNANQNGHPVEVILACCAECFIGCIENLVQYFNRYAYIEIALYGKSYIKAAKDTFHLFADRGVDALVNDSLVNITFMWGAYAIGALSTLLAYLYLHFTHPSYNTKGQYTVPVLVFAFVIGLTCTITIASAIEAGVSTIFVGLAEDPQVLAMRAPDLFEMVRETYPHVVSGV